MDLHHLRGRGRGWASRVSSRNPGGVSPTTNRVTPRPSGRIERTAQIALVPFPSGLSIEILIPVTCESPEQIGTINSIPRPKDVSATPTGELYSHPEKIRAAQVTTRLSRAPWNSRGGPPPRCCQLAG